MARQPAFAPSSNPMNLLRLWRKMSTWTWRCTCAATITLTFHQLTSTGTWRTSRCVVWTAMRCSRGCTRSTRSSADVLSSTTKTKLSRRKESLFRESGPTLCGTSTLSIWCRHKWKFHRHKWSQFHPEKSERRESGPTWRPKSQGKTMPSLQSTSDQLPDARLTKMLLITSPFYLTPIN